jgi:hypothetical protein
MGALACSPDLQAHIYGSIYLCLHGFICRSQQAHDKMDFMLTILFNFMTEFIFKPASSKECVPLVTKTSQGDGIMGVFEEI